MLAFSVGVFFFSIYVSYAYAFWIGGIWIGNSYYNHILNRLYMGDDIMSVFWGILFGLFALS